MNSNSLNPYALYLVTDRASLRGRDLLTAIEAAIQGGVTMVQLREKEISSRDLFQLAQQVKHLTDRYQIPLMINDHLDIAVAIDAAGVHVGQSDLPAPVVRQILGPDKILGVSATTLLEAEQAYLDGADYLGVGAIFPTTTKSDARSTPIERLAQIKTSVPLPVVAIGGINEKNLSLLAETDIDGIAVVSAILGNDDITCASEALCKQLPILKRKRL